MISLPHADQFGLDLARDYDTFALTLTGRYLAIQAAAGTPTPPFFIEQFSGLARGHVTQFIAGADNRIDGWVTDLGDGVDLSGRSEALKQSLRVIAIKNARDLATRLRGGHVGLKNLFTGPMGSLGTLLQRQLASPDLKSMDDAGRIWDSSKLVRTVGRDFAYQSLIDVQAYHLALDSDVAQVVYDDPEHVYHGMRISLSGADPKLTSLTSARKLIFHPNASAQLSHV
jgi:hypothetical protein